MGWRCGVNPDYSAAFAAVLKQTIEAVMQAQG
jgi:hypothetical protein